MAKSYQEIFFQWCVPGLVLVIAGQIMGVAALPLFGMALLSLGLLHYSRTKGRGRLWSAFWLTLSIGYLLLGMVELVRGV